MHATDARQDKDHTENERPPRDEAARARAYLDLWERHMIASATRGPILPTFRLPA